MRKGDRVYFFANWSSFRTMRGEVTQTAPYLMVRLDGDVHPIRVHEREVVHEQASEVSMTGAE